MATAPTADTDPTATTADATDPARPAPAGMVYVLLFRKRRGEPWREVARCRTAEEVWLTSLKMPSGHYREQLVKATLFDTAAG